MQYTITQISDVLGVAKETVRQWIVRKKLPALYSPDEGIYLVEERSLDIFIDDHPKYKRPEEAQRKEEDPKYKRPEETLRKEEERPSESDTMRNSEGYSDPTAFFAMRSIDEDERFRKLMRTIFNILDLAGFRLEGRITLIDKKTGKIYR